MDSNKKAYIVAVIALMHGGKRYEVGDEIKLSDEEAQKVILYLRPLAPKESAPQQPQPSTIADEQGKNDETTQDSLAAPPVASVAKQEEKEPEKKETEEGTDNSAEPDGNSSRSDVPVPDVDVQAGTETVGSEEEKTDGDKETKPEVLTKAQIQAQKKAEALAKKIALEEAKALGK